MLLANCKYITESFEVDTVCSAIRLGEQDIMEFSCSDPMQTGTNLRQSFKYTFL
jgi:hypothetical protein